MSNSANLISLTLFVALFKPNISVVILDQNPHTKPTTEVLPSGEKVVIDPEATTERMMLWFYLLINIGGFFGVPTAYLAKLVGFWPAFLLPGILYFLLPALLWVCTIISLERIALSHSPNFFSQISHHFSKYHYLTLLSLSGYTLVSSSTNPVDLTSETSAK